LQQYVIRRLILFVPTVWLVTLVVFLFLRIIPGDPALNILSGGGQGAGNYTQEDLEAMRDKMGISGPIYEQYGNWLWGLLHGDMGRSFYYGTDIKEMVKTRVYLTLELTGLGIAISFFLAVPLGIVSALNRNSVIDYAARVFTFLGLSIPTFVVALVIIFLLVRIFNWIPPLDYSHPYEDLGRNLEQLIFPAICIALFTMAFIARVTRSSLLETLRQDYVRTARSKGLKERNVVLVHALKNCFLPILTVTGWSFGILLAGEVIVEQIFVLPGMGRLLIVSILDRDYPVVQALVFLIATMVLILNLIIDLLYGYVDPRVRLA
jgi:peptide/nickel transport system permease protein